MVPTSYTQPVDLMVREQPVVSSFANDNLVVRGTSRIESIICSSEQRIDTTFYSWQVCRLLRRDFNFISTQMFFHCKVKAKKQAIHRFLSDIHDAAFDIQTVMLRHEMLPDIPSTTISFRIISIEARLLYDALMLVDRPMAKINQSEMKVVAVENFASLESRVNALKMSLMRETQRKN